MKPPEQVKLMILSEWLRKAQNDMAVAERLISEEEAMFANAVAFHSQQAAEKFLKAFLAWNQVDFPKSHDLKELLDLVATANGAIADELHDVIILTQYGVVLRYPGDRPDATLADAHEAVGLARKVHDAILPLLPQST
jgi:HEPN domain-containing protein